MFSLWAYDYGHVVSPHGLELGDEWFVLVLNFGIALEIWNWMRYIHFHRLVTCELGVVICKRAGGLGRQEGGGQQ